MRTLMTGFWVLASLFSIAAFSYTVFVAPVFQRSVAIATALSVVLAVCTLSGLLSED